MRFFQFLGKIFTAGRGVGTLVICLVLSSLLLRSTPEGKRLVVDTVLSTILFPVQKIVTATKGWEDLEEINRVLREENTKLRMENDLLQQSNDECIRLQEMAGFDSDFYFPLTWARVVARNPGRLFTTFVIDKGLRDSLLPDMPVITASGLVGRLSRVFNDHSHVKLLADPQARVSVLETRTRAVGVMESADSRRLLVSLPSHAKVQAGDTLVSSGMGGIFPKGIRVGVVASLEEGEIDVVQNAVVKPFQDPSYVEEVFVIRRLSRWRIDREEGK